MLVSVPTNSIELEIIRIAPVEFGYAIEYVVAVIVNRTQWWVRFPRREKFERLWRIAHAFVRIDFNALGMIHSDELELIRIQRLFQFVGHAQIITPVALS